MEKLYIKLVFLCLATVAFSQDTLCVYKTKGMSFIEINSQQKSLKKGTLIGKKDIIKILPDAKVTAIDNMGNSYDINKEGTYSLKYLRNFKTTKATSNFTVRYFKHLWDELRDKSEDKALIAGVFRGETLMRFPKDSCKIANSKIVFKWDAELSNNLYYLFVKNSSTNEVLKIETNGSQIALYDEHPIFNEGDIFQWTVTKEAFPNLDNIPFFNFKLIDRNTYETLKTKYSEFITDLENLGHSEIEINTILCETYGLCK